METQILIYVGFTDGGEEPSFVIEPNGPQFEPKTEDAIPGTEEEKGPPQWSGTVNKSGEYRIVVGGARGNASYTLRVSVK